MKILVVGLSPSKKHGRSPTLKTLHQWYDALGLQNVSIVNIYGNYELNEESDQSYYVKTIFKEYDKVLALGKTVSDTLKSMGIDHFRLPHPSGLNRQINDPKFVHEILESCKNYLDRG